MPVRQWEPIIQRFGPALNLNVHVDALVLDGVYAFDRGGRLRFGRTAAATLGPRCEMPVRRWETR